jgi:iron complex transport system substrate-binding protein
VAVGVTAAAPAAGVSDNTARIVSIGGAVTEILYALGAEQRIVAVDSTSLYPERALKEKPNVGYMRALSPEGVLGLNPSLILATEGSGPKEAIAVLKAASVPYLTVPEHFTGPGIVEKIGVVSTAVGASARGACLASAVQADLDALAHLRTRIEKPVRVLFLLSFMNQRPMVAGRATAADGVIALAGAANAMTAYEGYRLVNDEAIIAAKPDAVLVMQRDAHRLDADTVFRHPAFALTPAAQRRRFFSMDGLYLLGFGPRTALAARDLASALYPEIVAERLPSERIVASGEACK